LLRRALRCGPLLRLDAPSALLSTALAIRLVKCRALGIQPTDFASPLASRIVDAGRLRKSALTRLHGLPIASLRRLPFASELGAPNFGVDHRLTSAQQRPQ
jgi:hypothetical protein